jgi:hypothetical protein
MADKIFVAKSFLVKRNRKRPAFPKTETQFDVLELDRVDAAQSAAEDTDGSKWCDCSFLVTLFEIASYLFYAFLYILDCGSDLWAAYVYMTDHEDWHFWLTFIIVAVSSATIILINIYWYYCEYKDDKAVRPDGMPPKWVWAMRFCLTMCLLGPFLR